MRYKPGQRVSVKCGVEGHRQLAVSATFVRAAGKKALLLQDDDGNRFEAAAGDVYPSQEALEASLPELRVSRNEATGRVTEFPPNPRLTRRGETLWDYRAPGDASALGAKVPDWMMLPDAVVNLSPGPSKRRVVRQFIHPCPKTGRPVKTRELEGGLYCFESPGQGWLFSLRLTCPEGRWGEIQGEEKRP